MKYIVKDILRCVYIGVLIALGLGILLTIIALVFRLNILQAIALSWIYSGCLALLVGGISFLRPNTQRPLDYKNDWERYFKKLNIGHVILLIGTTLLILGIPVYNAWYYQNGGMMF